MSILPDSWTSRGQMDVDKFIGWLANRKDLYSGSSANSAEDADRVWNAIMTSDSETATTK